jgi:4-amino-4-deoxy-L-arabinose transferase-like glycosyltransferase
VGKLNPKIIAGLVMVAALGARWPALGEYLTVDEVAWMERSAHYWDVVLAGKPESTFVTTHPGATLMWLAGAGETIQEKRLGFEVHESNLAHFRKSAVAPVIIGASILIGLAILFSAWLWGRTVAMVAGMLLAFDPYLVGMTQVVHLDGLLALFMLNSLLAWLVFWKRRQWRYAIVAGGMLGLAGATKLVLALWLLPVMGVVVLGYTWRNKRWFELLIKSLGFVVGVGGLMFYATWPALWVKTDLTRSFTRDVSVAATWEHVEMDAGENAINPATFYLRTFLTRTTPVVWVGLLAMIWLGWRDRRRELGWIAGYALVFLLIMTLAAKKADRYAMPALVVLPVLSGWGLVRLRKMVANQYQRKVLAIIMVVLIVLIWGKWAINYPISYNNALTGDLRPLSQQGWGEGLEKAAAWLNKQPEAENLTIVSWYPEVIRAYFKGETISLAARYVERVDYWVIYRNMGGRAPDTLASEVLAETEGMELVFTADVQGVPYVWIYVR